MQASEDDLIYMIGELYAQRRMEQTKNQVLAQHNEVLLQEIRMLKAEQEEQEGGNDVAN